MRGFKTMSILLLTLPLLVTGCGSKPSEKQILSNARKILSVSEDHKCFAIKDVKIINTLSEGKVFNAKIKYTVIATKYDILMSTTGNHHILPLGHIKRGKSYSGTFHQFLSLLHG